MTYLEFGVFADATYESELEFYKHNSGSNMVAHPKCNKKLDLDSTRYLEVFKVSDCKSEIKIENNGPKFKKSLDLYNTRP